jgi:heat shock protein HtpX
MTVAATLAGAISYLSHLAFFFGGRDRNSNPIALLAMVLLGPIAALLIHLAISRQREYAADAEAARMAGQPFGLIGALEKLGHYSKRIPMRDAEPATAHMYIVNPLSGGGLASLFSTHPPLPERIRRLQGMVG